MLVKMLQADPVFLHIKWILEQEGGESVTFEASLCRAHREQIYLQNPSARGSRRFGSSCDLCEGRGPRRA